MFSWLWKSKNAEEKEMEKPQDATPTPEQDDRIGFRWIALISLWTLLSGPVFHGGKAPESVGPQPRPKVGKKDPEPKVKQKKDGDVQELRPQEQQEKHHQNQLKDRPRGRGRWE